MNESVVWMWWREVEGVWMVLKAVVMGDVGILVVEC